MNQIKNIWSRIIRKTEFEEPSLYYSYYLFGLSGSKPIWDWENWEKCIPLIQPIINLCSKPAFITTSQSVPIKYGKENQYVSYNKGTFRFGQMIWNSENNKKWTTKYINEENWTFFNTEIAIPTRSYCQKNQINPELLITVQNENLSRNCDLKIDQGMSIHILAQLVLPEELIRIEQQIKQIGSLLNLKIAGKIKRPAEFKSKIGTSYADPIWFGTFGVIDHRDLEFCKNYKEYGIERFI
jgi:hypothetical protein